MSRDHSPIVRPVETDEEYTWIHRAFLQAFQTHGVLTVDEMKPLLAYVITAFSKHIYLPKYTSPTLTHTHRSRAPMDRRRHYATANQQHSANHQRQNRALRL